MKNPVRYLIDAHVARGSAWFTGADEQAVSFNMDTAAGGLTQYDSQSVVQAVITNGKAFSNLTNNEIDESGYVTAIFDNGVTRRIAQLPVVERVTDRRFDQADMRAAVETGATETVGVHRMFDQQGGDRIGQLDLASSAWRGAFQ